MQRLTQALAGEAMGLVVAVHALTIFIESWSGIMNSVCMCIHIMCVCVERMHILLTKLSRSGRGWLSHHCAGGSYSTCWGRLLLWWRHLPCVMSLLAPLLYSIIIMIIIHVMPKGIIISRTKSSMISIRVHWNPNVTPDLSSQLLLRLKNARRLTLASKLILSEYNKTYNYL